jgi:hypothetical protein
MLEDPAVIGFLLWGTDAGIAHHHPHFQMPGHQSLTWATASLREKLNPNPKVPPTPGGAP